MGGGSRGGGTRSFFISSCLCPGAFVDIIVSFLLFFVHTRVPRVAHSGRVTRPLKYYTKYSTAVSMHACMQHATCTHLPAFGTSRSVREVRYHNFSNWLKISPSLSLSFSGRRDRSDRSLHCQPPTVVSTDTVCHSRRRLAFLAFE